MNTDILTKRFAEMGARVRVHPLERRSPWRQPAPVAVDVIEDRKGEIFDVTVAEPDIEFTVQDVRPNDRHLLLLVSQPGTRPNAPRLWDRFLCGHDERHWFVAGVPGSVTSVRQAMESLKPQHVRQIQAVCRVKGKAANRRHNAAFIRQGEWFFVPAPDLRPDPHRILANEPIRRGGGKPHMVEFLYRRGGTTVHVCPQFPNGLTQAEYQALVHREPDKRKLAWRTMTREPEAYAKGRVRHPDHKTIELSGWHRILPNEEVRRQTMAFLD